MKLSAWCSAEIKMSIVDINLFHDEMGSWSVKVQLI